MAEPKPLADELASNAAPSHFRDIDGERFFAIDNVDAMAPFFVSVVSNTDHWLFVSSTGGLTAGRVSPAWSLFPYIPVDRVHDSWPHTGSKTILRVGETELWEPFRGESLSSWSISRNLYKNLLGNKLMFEERNLDLGLTFRYTWMTSDEFGFARAAELINHNKRSVSVEILDGLQNILPAGTPRTAQTNTSNLVDAYKWSEVDASTGHALFALYSGVSDRAAPSEALKANTVFCLGLPVDCVLLSSAQLDTFRLGKTVKPEEHRRGIRGAFFVVAKESVHAGATLRWQIVADVEQTQAMVVERRTQLLDPTEVRHQLSASIDRGSDELARIMAQSDGFEVTAEENVSAHHYANVLFNVLRGGIFDDQYTVTARDLLRTIEGFNSRVFDRNRAFLDTLPESLSIGSLLERVSTVDDPQLERLCREYLPITFGRRHGDPSRPWNEFVIRLRDTRGNRLLSYQGNWRDVFQNWEALTFSYPEFIENVIGKFVNASTADGYNPYRITKEGIDWEVEDPDDPWSYIGYWGDHQIIYLQKLLELSRQFHPQSLHALLDRPVFSYANVPYRIKPFDRLLADPKNTVTFDDALAAEIESRVDSFGADGKLVADANGDVYLVNLLEKLLVPLLAKLGNLVVDGGIWLNTQRPEWNDANNALVGHGLSMVTLYYLRRYVVFLEELLADREGDTELSAEVATWLSETAGALHSLKPFLGEGAISPGRRLDTLRQLGEAASRYRKSVYRSTPFSAKQAVDIDHVVSMLADARAAIEHSIATNRRDDGLYHAYNLMDLGSDVLNVTNLYTMLEGQVAVLSAATVQPNEACALLETLFASDVYRDDQQSFMLYPDRPLPTFLEKNRIPSDSIESLPVVQSMLSRGDDRIVSQDIEGVLRFNASFRNAEDLVEAIGELEDTYGADLKTARDVLLETYETVFNHRAFTGRSGGMFGFEGLGCIYWHMVSKLLLAVQENFFRAVETDADPDTVSRLGTLYYRVRDGLGFNKAPDDYGAFPLDPYSHTPRHAGARQPGMTGTVKEEILTRFGELGLRIDDGSVRILPALLREQEFGYEAASFRYLDLKDQWQTLAVPERSLAFTWCQTPVLYTLSKDSAASLDVHFADGDVQTQSDLALDADTSASLFQRSGNVAQLVVTLPQKLLFSA